MRFWPVWTSSEAAERMEDKIDEMRRDLSWMKQKIGRIERLLIELDVAAHRRSEGPPTQPK